MHVSLQNMWNFFKLCETSAEGNMYLFFRMNMWNLFKIRTTFSDIKLFPHSDMNFIRGCETFSTFWHSYELQQWLWNFFHIQTFVWTSTVVVKTCFPLLDIRMNFNYKNKSSISITRTNLLASISTSRLLLQEHIFEFWICITK